MALIICPECGKEFSNKASACPNCGCPTEEIIKDIKSQETQNIEPEIIKCPYCGEQLQPDNDYCDNCGTRLTPYVENKLQSQPEHDMYTICPVCGIHNHLGVFICRQCGHKYSINEYQNSIITPPHTDLPNESFIMCKKCGSQNIQITIKSVGEISHSKSEMRKKSIVTRTANNIGRTGMILATGGLWALTPKKSKYTELCKESTDITNKKFCICQNCGYSWQIS